LADGCGRSGAGRSRSTPLISIVSPELRAAVRLPGSRSPETKSSVDFRPSKRHQNLLFRDLGEPYIFVIGRIKGTDDPIFSIRITNDEPTDFCCLFRADADEIVPK
jgi:hypothetical protein